MGWLVPVLLTRMGGGSSGVTPVDVGVVAFEDESMGRSKFHSAAMAKPAFSAEALSQPQFASETIRSGRS